MDYIGIPTRVLDGEPFLLASPLQHSVWLRLLRYCYGQENGGKVTGANAWNDRKWSLLARVTWREVHSGGGALWRWEGEDLVVNYYQTHKEEEYKLRRQVCSDAAKARWRKEKTPDNATSNASSIPTTDAHADASSNAPCICDADTDADASRNGKERKKERKKDACTLGKGAGEGAGAEVPSLAEVLSFAREWPGDLTRGLAGPIEADYAQRWFEWRVNSARAGFETLRDWRMDLATRWVRDEPKRRQVAVAGATAAGPSAGPGPARGMTRQQERDDLLAEAGRLKGESDAAAQERRAAIRARLAALDGEVAR